MNILYATCYLDVSGVTRINFDILKRISGEFSIYLCETERDKHSNVSLDRYFADEFREPFKLWRVPKQDRYAGFVRFLAQHRISIIYVTHSLWVYEHAARLKRDVPGLAIVDSLHVLEPYCFRGGYPDISANRFVHPFIDKSIVISDHLLSYIRRNYHIDPAKFVVVKNGVDTERFKKDTTLSGMFRREINITNDVPLIGFIGRFTTQKRPQIFLEVVQGVAKQINNAQFFMIGGGELVEKTKRVAKQLGVAHRIRFLPPRDDIPVVLNSTDLLLLTSSYEGAPLTVLEALAVGVPVVASNVGAIAEYVGESCLVPRQKGFREIDCFVAAVLKTLSGHVSPVFDRDKLSLARVAQSYAAVLRAASAMPVTPVASRNRQTCAC